MAATAVFRQALRRVSSGGFSLVFTGDAGEQRFWRRFGEGRRRRAGGGSPVSFWCCVVAGYCRVRRGRREAAGWGGGAAAWCCRERGDGGGWLRCWSGEVGQQQSSSDAGWWWQRAGAGRLPGGVGWPVSGGGAASRAGGRLSAGGGVWLGGVAWWRRFYGGWPVKVRGGVREREEGGLGDLGKKDKGL
ncbi:PREDICTED: uncharacterized protein LOC109157584 [Ipomoea nil]|uniref:uncharacterized protein LOC109157584 n=1 Tax=Ipomoea nil TaxID=35883 RepID=UPI00090170E1|nr:PREDICTED: uncharacterized protein LOC109157584 [Ipomoea nil]